MSFDLFLENVRTRNEHHIRRRLKVWTGTKAYSGFAGAQNEITHKMMPHCGIPVSRRRRAKNPDHLSTSRAHRLLLERGFDRRVVDPVISAWKNAVSCAISCRTERDVGYRGTACVARVRTTRDLENTIHFAWAPSHPIVPTAMRSLGRRPARRQVSAERERKATRIISPSTAVVGGTDHHRQSDLR